MNDGEFSISVFGNAAKRGDPQRPALIREEGLNSIAGQAVFDRVLGELSVFISAQTGVRCADPDCAGFILRDRPESGWKEVRSAR